MIQIGKGRFINPAHIEEIAESKGGVAIFYMVSSSRTACEQEYWPAAKAQLIPPAPHEAEALAALRELDAFAIKFNISAHTRTLDVPEGKTVSETLIAMAKALRENNVTPQADSE